MSKTGICTVCGKSTEIFVCQTISELSLHESEVDELLYEVLHPVYTITDVCKSCGDAWGEQKRKEWEAEHDNR